MPCGEYDPAPQKLPKGTVAVDEVWMRLACDVTHVGKTKFVSIIDCGPSRFAVWQPVAHETEREVVALHSWASKILLGGVFFSDPGGGKSKFQKWGGINMYRQGKLLCFRVYYRNQGELGKISTLSSKFS